jgi:hypothetical protein
MARTKKQPRPESISGMYFAIPKTVTDSVSFKGATSSAKALLFALMQQHNGINNGHLHLTKGWLSNQGWTCDESNRKATKGLIERGLVVQTRWGGLNAGTSMYALTWYAITNWDDLQITAKGYHRGAYMLCKLPPTPRRKPPARKQQPHHDDRDSSGSTTELVRQLAGSTTEPEKLLFDTFTGSTAENNVVIPLPPVKSIKRIVGVKGKSGITKIKPNLTVSELSVMGLIH